MNIKPGDYILGYWMASDADNNNWYMMAWKHNNQWFTEYTFRYCIDNNEDPWNGKDKKTKYKYEIEGNLSEEDFLKYLNSLFNVIKQKFNNFHDFFLVQGDGKKFTEIAKTKRYLHMKEFVLK